MFCTKCGNQLHDEDKFCARCGAKVREDVSREAPTASKYEEVVFNPPFREEAEKRTRQLTEENPYSKDPKKESVHFDWNLDGFPGKDSKKDEEIELNWEAVIERRREPKPVTVEKLVPEEQPAADEELEQPKAAQEDLFIQEAKKEEPLSIADLERELFGTAPANEASMDEKGATIQYSRANLPKDKEQFFTYNAKRGAFQELLDKERSRIEEMESQRKTEWEEITPREVPEREIKEPPKFEDVFIEPEMPLVPPVREVAVVLPPLTATVMAAEDDSVEASAGEPTEAPDEATIDDTKETAKEEEDLQPPFRESKEKTKLRYSDIFPEETFKTGDSGSGGDDGGSDIAAKKEIAPAVEEDDDEDEDYKGNKVIKTLIAILAVIVAIELVVIGAKAIAPDSGFSRAVDQLMAKVTAVFTGEEEEPDPTAEVEETSYMYQYVNELAETGDKIGEVTYQADLKYDMSKTYAFEQIGQTTEFTGEPAGSDEDETAKSIVEAVIGYYNGWQDKNQDENLVGINSLEIGEVRSGTDEYYVLNKVTFAAADGSTVTSYQTVRLAATDSGVLVDEVKEETV